MREFSGSLAGRPWHGWMPERPGELRKFMEWIYHQARTSTPVSVDTEGKGLDILCGDPGYVRLVQFGTETEAWVIPVELGAAFESATRTALDALPVLTGHNWACFDALALWGRLGVDFDALCRKALDTQILAKLVDPRQQMEGGIGSGLKPLSAFYIDPQAPDTQNGLTAVFRSLGLTKATGWAGIDLFNEVYCEYAALDVILTSRLRPILLAELKRLGVRDLLVTYEHELVRICAHMQAAGMYLDEEYTRALDERLAEEEEKYGAVAKRFGVSSVNSGAQIAEALTYMGEELKEKTAGGAPKTDKAVLLKLADLDRDWKRIGARDPNPLADAVLRSKRAGKWRTTYAQTFLDVVDGNGYVHPFINSMQARTGRMSVTRPAVQTLPSSDWMIRRCLLAEPGHVMISTDFQAIEMRVLAALADVKKMKEGFAAGGADFDIHMFTAELIKGIGNATTKDRKLFKGAGFGKVYGGGVTTLARQTGAAESEIAQAVAAYDRVFPEIKRYSGRLQREAFGNGMVHISVTGRRLPLDRDRTYAVVNYACQSAARDVLGQAMLNMEEAGLLPYMRLPIHDETLCSVPEREAQEVAREIERCMSFDLFGVPVVATADIGGRSWGSLYMKDASDKYNAQLLIEQDEYFRRNPAAAHALAA